MAAVCRAAFREAACHDPAQRRSGLTLGCVHSPIHIGSQHASNSMWCSGPEQTGEIMQTFVTATSMSVAIKQNCMLHVARQLCIVLYITLCTLMCMHPLRATYAHSGAFRLRVMGSSLGYCHCMVTILWGSVRCPTAAGSIGSHHTLEPCVHCVCQTTLMH